MSNSSVELTFYTAPWCAACRDVKPWVEEQARRTAAQMRVVNIDDEPGEAQALGLRGVPAVALRRDGEVVDLILSTQIRGRLPAALGGL